MRIFENIITSLILGIFLIFTLVYALNNPIFEGPDEVGHYVHAELMTHSFIPVIPDMDTTVIGQYHHPPLYYWFTSLIVRAYDNSQVTEMGRRYNPFYRGNYSDLIGAVGSDNNNLFLHRANERFPNVDNPVAQSVYVIRMTSIAMGFLTLIGCVLIFRVVFPKSVSLRLVALGSVAFWPQFNYISSVMNNDNLAILGVTYAVLMMLYILRDQANWKNTILLGIFSGIAVLSKANSLTMAIPIALTLLLTRSHIKYWITIFLITLAVGAWWYIRNIILYGDPTLLSVVPLIPGTQLINPDGSFSLQYGLQNMVFVYETFWARFGGGAVAIGNELYYYFNTLTIITIAGGTFWMIKSLLSFKKTPPTRRSVQITLVFLTFGISLLGAVFYFAGKHWGNNLGRYLIPFISFLGISISIGIFVWIPQKLRQMLVFPILIIMFSVGASALFRYFVPAYQVAPVPQSIDYPLYYRFGNVAELIGMSPTFPRALPDEKIQITLYWRALAPADDNLRVALHSAQTDVVRRDSYPGAGNLLASDWQAGQTWSETYWVSIPDDAPTQISDILIVKLYDGETLAELPIVGRDDIPLTVANIGTIAINAPPTPVNIAYRLGDKIGFTQPVTTIQDNAVEVCLSWSALQFPEGNYNVFVHILSPDGQLVDQYDAAPMNNRYPTGGWREGERVDECVTISLEKLITDDFTVGLGMVDGITFARLRMTKADGSHIQNDILLIPMRQP